MAGEKTTSSKRKRTEEDDGAAHGLPGPKRPEFFGSDMDEVITITATDIRGARQTFTVHKDLAIKNSGYIKDAVAKGSRALSTDLYSRDMRVYLSWLYGWSPDLYITIQGLEDVETSKDEMIVSFCRWRNGGQLQDPIFQDAVMHCILRSSAIRDYGILGILKWAAFLAGKAKDVPLTSKLWLWLIDAAAATIKEDDVDEIDGGFLRAIFKKLVSHRNSRTPLSLPTIDDFQKYRTAQ